MTTGIIFDLKRYALHDGPGIRTTVFMKGCPLACRWCHNPEGMSPEPLRAYRKDRCIRCGECVRNCPARALRLEEKGVFPSGATCRGCFTCADVCPAEAVERIGRTVGARELFEEIRRDLPFYDTSEGGVTFSGGEPLMQPDFLTRLLELCGRAGIHRAVDTSGHAPEATLMGIARQTDLFLYDLKLMDARRHETFTGVSNRLILSNLERLTRAGKRLIVRIPLIPGVNDDDENLDRTGSHLSRLGGVERVDLLPYHGFQKNKYERFGFHPAMEPVAPHGPDVLRLAKKRIENFGIDVSIRG